MNKETTSHKHHILPLSIYLGVGAALIVLTSITVTVSFYDFGPYNLLVAMIIAAIKASLVALFFMHLKYDNKLYMVIFVSSIIFLAAFVILTMFDTLRRDDIYRIESKPVNKQAVIYDNIKADTSVTHSDSLLLEKSPQ